MMAARADNTSTLSFQASASNAWLPMRRLTRIFDTIITDLTASASASGQSVYAAGDACKASMSRTAWAAMDPPMRNSASPIRNPMSVSARPCPYG